MRVIFDHQIFSLQKYGGISRYFAELVNQLSLVKEVQVSVISPTYINAYLSSSLSDVNVVGTRAPIFKGSHLIYRAVNRVLAKPLANLYRPDLVHETYYAAQTMAPKGCKVVLTVYDMIHERFTNDFATHDTVARDKVAAVRRADHVICISEHTRQDLINLHGVDPEKTSVIHLGFSLSQTRDQVESPITRPFLLYVGIRAGYKNFASLLKAYASSPSLMKDYQLVAFGGGALTSSELELARRLGIPTGQLLQIPGGDDVLAGLYRKATVFIYPSLYEGFGIPPLEAMSFGCPVVCSNTSSIPEVVGNAALMFDPLLPDQIAQAISAALGDAATRQTLVARGYEQVKQFSWAACAQQTLSVYQQVLA
ncbi:glycosyltransferase family 1 protein [Rhodoferax sp.]|uniref:glycosyltransferase family 4 protein n=1 Tax=Rhodoferax sp. TaxID=50421 RepID=UPI00284DF6AB|nr:glycosyltransferase family 1 protein [Rhodoferax sp.]MDR3371568.1 glycosyltransferase family 1 protein [Rhodoferax sp.]